MSAQPTTTTTTTTTAGRRVAEARRRAGLTQAQLAERIGTGRVSVARIEADRQTPSVDVALAIATAVTTPVEALFSPEASGPADARERTLQDWKREHQPRTPMALEEDTHSGYFERGRIWRALNDGQRRALRFVVRYGTGCKINGSTARALERRGLVECYENPILGSMTASATEMGRKVAEQHPDGSRGGA
jgi:putative transcriptional regulator